MKERSGYPPVPLPHTCMASPLPTSIAHQPQLTVGFTLSVVRPMGLDEYIRTNIHHFSVMQSILTALGIPRRFL